MLLNYIDRFGVQAVLGRPVLAYHEIRDMLTSENIIHAYANRQKSGDWGKWSETYPQDSKMLIEIEKKLHAEN